MDVFVRLIFWFLTHTIYKIKVNGQKNFPIKGPALLVCNHLSYVDPFLIGASVPRHIRFFIWRKICDFKPLAWLFKIMKAIPISPDDKPKQFLKSLEEAEKALKNGEVVCLFAEGRISRTGQILGFKKGVEYIVKYLDIPIIPVHLDEVWGSIFSFYKGKFIWKMPERIPYPVTVSYGEHLSSKTSVYQIRQAVQELESNAIKNRIEKMQTLNQILLRNSKRRWFNKSVRDTNGYNLNFGKTITASFILAKKFIEKFPDEKHVGVLLPPSVPCVLVNIALTYAGKIPINLNYTMSNEIIEKIQKKAGLNKIITSPKMLEALNWKHDDRMIYLEDFEKPSKIESLLIYIFLFITPSKLLETVFLPKAPVKNDELATIIFTSGSTGTPKGVMLTHSNILSNLQALQVLFNLNKYDTTIGVLPFFHSFGYTATLWFPLIAGFQVVYHKSPLESVIIQKIIKENKATFIMTTPTFLQMWMKKFNKDDIGSLKFIIVGAEKLRESIANEFNEKFGIPVLEGYGTTELSPVACVSVLNVQDRDEFQLGNKIGKVGRPIPGVIVKIVEPETNSPLQINQSGLMLIKGPNVMKGYWQDEIKTNEVIKDGWYITGDIAMIDEDGFIAITDRLSRFSKIGGEMVPHILIEENLYNITETQDARFLVVSIPDEKKGESLAVLYHNYSNDITLLHEKLNQTDLPKLWIPDKRLFFKVDEWPILGTGKVDMTRAKELAKKFRELIYSS